MFIIGCCAGAVPVVTSTGVPNGPLTGPPAFAPGFAQGAPGMLMGGLPQGQPFIMVPAGAQPPQVRPCPSFAPSPECMRAVLRHMLKF